MTPRSRTRARAAATIATVALVAGCSGGEGNDDDATELATLGQDEFYSAVIGAQEEEGSFRFALKNETAGQKLTAEGDAIFEEDEIAVKSTGSAPGGGSLQLIQVDDIFYVQADGLELGKATWLEVDPKNPDPSTSFIAPLLALTDPSKLVTALEDPAKFELVGEEQVGGVATNHYEIGVESAAYVEKLELPAQLGELLPATVEFDMWVDASDLPRKITQAFEVQGQQSSSEFVYSDYGAEVSIEAPPASDTATKMQGMPVPDAG